MHPALKVKDNKTSSIMVQVAILFAACVLLTGLFTYATQYYSARKYVARETERRAAKTASEVELAVREYPAYRWLLSYWSEHAYDMNIDYDENYRRGTWTAMKVRLLTSHQPDFEPMYATEEEVKALPEEDQKLYAMLHRSP